MIARLRNFAIVCIVCIGAFALVPAQAGQGDNGLHPFDAELLAAHNQERAQFGAPPLAWSEKLTREANEWAQRLAREGAMRHASLDDRGGRGENLWMGTVGYFSASAMIEAFNSERRHFKPGKFPQISHTGNWYDVGHYSQVVWPQTREVGCALARNQADDFLVCRYWPAGNIYGETIRPAPRFTDRDSDAQPSPN